MRTLLVIFLLFPISAFANTIDCGNQTIERLYVQADRGGHLHENSVVIILGDDKSSACSSVGIAIISNSDPAYSGVLSMALAAHTSGSKLRVVVDDTHLGSNTYYIQWVNTP